MEEADKDRETKIAIAEIMTKAQSLSERMSFVEDFMKQLHGQAHRSRNEGNGPRPRAEYGLRRESKRTSNRSNLTKFTRQRRHSKRRRLPLSNLKEKHSNDRRTETCGIVGHSGSRTGDSIQPDQNTWSPEQREHWNATGEQPAPPKKQESAPAEPPAKEAKSAAAESETAPKQVKKDRKPGEKLSAEERISQLTAKNKELETELERSRAAATKPPEYQDRDKGQGTSQTSQPVQLSGNEGTV